MMWENVEPVVAYFKATFVWGPSRGRQLYQEPPNRTHKCYPFNYLVQLQEIKRLQREADIHIVPTLRMCSFASVGTKIKSVIQR
jgi:hypothetical protein